MTTQSHEFRAEVKELLDLVIHSLYTHKDVFLRELISNASDAIDKARYESLTQAELLEGDEPWKIKLIADKAAGTLTVRDNGIGLTLEEAVAQLGTIAHSGTKEFLRSLKERGQADNPDLIGQFGVGFYAAFMVADCVTVLSRKAGQPKDKAVRWESEAHGTFAVSEAIKETKGTDIILHIKKDEEKYLEPWELRSIVRKYSDYIEHPIVMDVERDQPSELDPKTTVRITEEDTLNSRQAIWLKKPQDISETEYEEFYHHVSHDYQKPAATIHYRAEGSTEFSALLYVPTRAPFDINYKDYKIGPSLYTRRVQVMENAQELVPPYLRFVRGVVESADLPLNVSRETLQNNRVVETMKKSITKKTLTALAELKTGKPEAYEEFYKGLGRVLREGLHYDAARKEEIAGLALFESTATESGKTTDLDAYLSRMKPDQEDIYFIIGKSRAESSRAPYLEGFIKRGIEVLFLFDEVDDILMANLGSYKDKKLKNVVKGDILLGDEPTKPTEEKQSTDDLMTFMNEALKDKVQEVRASTRLTDSPCCLVTADDDMDPNMRRLLESMGQHAPEAKRTLELNPSHPLVEAMAQSLKSGMDKEKLRHQAVLLYGQAQLLAGSTPDDPAAFTRAIAELMQQSLKH